MWSDFVPVLAVGDSQEGGGYVAILSTCGPVKQQATCDFVPVWVLGTLRNAGLYRHFAHMWAPEVLGDKKAFRVLCPC